MSPYRTAEPIPSEKQPTSPPAPEEVRQLYREVVRVRKQYMDYLIESGVGRVEVYSWLKDLDTAAGGLRAYIDEQVTRSFWNEG